MIKRLFLILISILIFCSISFGRAKYQGIAEKGGKSVKTNTTTTYSLAETYPSCTITVYVAGTTTLASLYSNNSGTTKSNPFTASVDASFFFYADNGRYDIKFSGTGIASAFTKSDILLVDPVVPATVNSILDPYQFGAFGTGVTHLITSQDIAAHPEWLGSYNTTYEWDTVAIQECLYNAFGTGVPIRFPDTTYLNREVNFRNGRFRINHGLHINGLLGFKITGIRKATTLLWTGSTASESVIFIDAMSYGEIGGFTIEASATNTAALLDVDYTGTYLSLKQQQLSFHDIDYIGNGAASNGFRLNFISTSSGQGDTITIDNCSEFGFTNGNGAYLSGANVLQITVKNGDSQGNKIGYFLNGAQVYFLNKHFENGGPTQVDKEGFDVYQEPQPLDGTLTVIDGTRTESMQLAFGVNKIINSRVAVGNEVGSWIASTPFQQGNVILAGGKAWINVSANPTLGSYADISAPFSTTVLTVPTPVIAGALVGKPLSIKYPNCFTIVSPLVNANTTTTITLNSAIAFLPGDGVGQPCGPHTTYAVYSGPYPTTGGSQPNWDNAGQAIYHSGLSGSDIGAATTSGSPNVTTQPIFNASYIGFPIFLAKAGIGGANFYSTISGVTDASHIVLADNAGTTISAADPTFGTGFRTKSLVGNGGVVIDGTVTWLQYNFYNIAMQGTYGKIEDCSFNAGRIWGITPNMTIDDSFFTRNDWLHLRLVCSSGASIASCTVLNNFTERRNVPSGVAPLTNIGIGNLLGGIMSGSKTLAELTAMTDILNGTTFYCSNCDTPASQGATCSASGDHAGAEAKRIRGIFKCY